jgi:hypothetical protein
MGLVRMLSINRRPIDNEEDIYLPVQRIRLNLPDRRRTIYMITHTFSPDIRNHKTCFFLAENVWKCWKT